MLGISEQSRSGTDEANNFDRARILQGLDAERVTEYRYEEHSGACACNGRDQPARYANESQREILEVR